MSDSDELAAIKRRVEELVQSGATKEGAPIGQFMGAMVTLARIQVRLCQMGIEQLEQKSVMDQDEMGVIRHEVFKAIYKGLEEAPITLEHYFSVTPFARDLTDRVIAVIRQRQAEP